MTIPDTLLLDEGFQPRGVISWQRAVCMTFVGKVEVLCSHDCAIRTVSQAYPAPSVVRLLHQFRVGQARVRFSRTNIYLRDGYRCQYCWRSCAHKELTLDHVVPRSRGGKTSWKNVVAACGDCNRRKGNRTPEQAGLPLRSVPTRPSSALLRPFRVKLEHVPESWRTWLH